jgi:hypothetical protein
MCASVRSPSCEAGPVACDEPIAVGDGGEGLGSGVVAVAFGGDVAGVAGDCVAVVPGVALAVASVVDPVASAVAGAVGPAAGLDALPPHDAANAPAAMTASAKGRRNRTFTSVGVRSSLKAHEHRQRRKVRLMRSKRPGLDGSYSM